MLLGHDEDRLTARLDVRLGTESYFSVPSRSQRSVLRLVSSL